MIQTEIFGRVERWRDHLVFGSVVREVRRRRPRLRPLLARIADRIPFEDITDPTRNRGAWLGLPDIWPGDRSRGTTFLDAWGRDPKALYEPSVDALLHGHGFSWLRDLAAVGSAEACTLAHAATAYWLERYGRWHALAWRSDLLARRLASWTSHFSFITDGAPDAETRQATQDALIASARRQLRHLCRAGAEDVDGQARIGALCNGIVAAIALMPGQAIGEQLATKALLRLMARLARTLGEQLHPDGGHVGRSPAQQFATVCDLAAARHALSASLLGVPDWLQHALDRSAPVLRMLRHGDGALALFHGAQEGSAEAIDLALDRAQAAGASPTVARHSGYARIAAGNAVLIMDCGVPPRADAEELHAGPLAFELSIGRQRVIVNCGAMVEGGAAWRNAMRATAAHSTLTVADTNADPRALREGVDEPRFSEHEGACLIEATHAGYAQRFGLLHRRALYCDAAGQDWRGEDTLVPAGGASAERQSFTLRFHLHPRVRATLAQDQATVLIRLPDKSGWRFRARGGQVRLAASIYVPDGETVQRTEQIVVTGATDHNGAQVRWALQRVA